ncbi:MAG TPA: diguanylate cyclase [Pyrinomonadaceae bacterium]|jgi:diguanylate cyclase (GGDEF)-like protein|nr:diguanylate cyclase [Pyrinomonadaceae bacterium]
MEKIAAAERAKFQNEELQALPEWERLQASVAAETDLAILLVDGHQPPQLAISNNNSICHALQSSTTHAHLCDPYCGVAFQRAQEAGEATHYRCHAGLHCFAMPVGLDASRPLAVIGGRAFLSGADYRELAERFRKGDLRELLSTELFRNVIFAARHNLDELAAQLAEISSKAGVRSVTATTVEPAGQTAGGHVRAAAQQSAQPGEVEGNAYEKGAGDVYFPPGIKLQVACETALKRFSERFKIKSVALMLRTKEGFAPACAMGRFKNKLPDLSGKGKKGEPQNLPGSVEGGAWQSYVFQDEETELFPLVVGDELKGALLVGDAKLPEEKRRGVNEFCLEIAMPLEVLRLREELERNLRASYHLQTFTQQINEVEPSEAYAAILRHSTELLRSERGSLLLFDEAANELEVKAAVGPRADVTQDARVRVGESVSGAVLLDGRPRVVRDLTATELHRAPAERKYKTDSFISYPIITGGRKVGVINMTDKAGGEPYDEIDLHLLESMAPQMALALDRAGWHQKATQFQLLSITDPLTGLLNRRYLEERLAEEFERSKRHRFPMSFLMIDIDNFKEYNDRHGHQAGDLALEITAQCLKSALRSADVASRYGGEEFSILLPQTSATEALVIAERIRSRVEKSSYPHGESQPRGAITVSIGISAFGPKIETPSGIIGAADHALYVAKSRGKNCVVSYVLPAKNTPVTPARDVN